MNCRRMTLLATVVLLTVGLSGCTYVMKTAQGRKAFKKTESALQKTNALMTADARKKAFALMFLKKDGADLQQAPYPAFTRKIAALADVRNKLKPIQAAVQRLAREYDRTVGKKKRVRSDDQPRWGQVQSIIQRLKAQHSAARGVANRYQSASKALAKDAKSHRIGKLNVAKLSKKLKSALKKITPELGKAQRKIKQTEALLLSKEGKWPAAKLAKKRSILGKMRQQMGVVEASTSRIHAANKYFTRVTGQQKHAWIGPGTRLFNIVDRIKKDVVAIKKAAAKLRSLEKQLRSKK
jgi:hypothetical protein